jgi:hypothetical protein
VKVIVPVASYPPDNVAESSSVGAVVPRVTDVALGVVTSDGLVLLTVTGSKRSLLSEGVALLLVSPE